MNRRQPRTQRPFRVVFTQSMRADAARIHVVFNQLLPATHEHVVRLFFGELSAFVKCGALSGERMHPASLRAETHATDVSTVTATQEWTDIQLPVEALTSILNMLEWLHHHAAPILEVQLAWGTPLLPAIANAVAFPGAWPKLGFALAAKRRKRRFDIEVGFRERQPLDYLDRVLHEVGAWFTAVNRGAYGDDRVSPASCNLGLTGDAVELSTERMVVYVDELHANQAALDGLTNVIERVHRKLVAVSHLRLR